MRLFMLSVLLVPILTATVHARPYHMQGEMAGEATADEGNLDLVTNRFAVGWHHVGVVEIVGVLAGRLDVLLVAVSAETLVSLGSVLVSQRSGIHDRSIAPGPRPCRISRAQRCGGWRRPG